MELSLTKSKEQKLSKKLSPTNWITNDLKALDVALTIEKASKQWVWQYSKWILALIYTCMNSKSYSLRSMRILV